MRIVCISDTHGHFPSLPEGDVLVHTGDYSSGRGSPEETLAFYRWIGSQPFDRVFTVPGNHDLKEETMPNWCAEVARNNMVSRLVDQAWHFNGINFYGSPWQPSFGHGWAFNLPRYGGELRDKWKAIPDSTDVLLTHGPLFSVLDLTRRLDNAGCKDLGYRVQELAQLKLHVFGHIHESYGETIIGKTHFVNASSCDLRHKLVNLPIVIDL